MTISRFEGRCHTCGHDHDAENEEFQRALSARSASTATSEPIKDAWYWSARPSADPKIRFEELAKRYKLREGHERADALRWFLLGRESVTPSATMPTSALIAACRGLISYWTRNLRNFQWEKADEHVKRINIALGDISDSRKYEDDKWPFPTGTK